VCSAATGRPPRPEGLRGLKMSVLMISSRKPGPTMSSLMVKPSQQEGSEPKGLKKKERGIPGLDVSPWDGVPFFPRHGRPPQGASRVDSFLASRRQARFFFGTSNEIPRNPPQNRARDLCGENTYPTIIRPTAMICSKPLKITNLHFSKKQFFITLLNSACLRPQGLRL